VLLFIKSEEERWVSYSPLQSAGHPEASYRDVSDRSGEMNAGDGPESASERNA
jgi:hypothetical protein